MARDDELPLLRAYYDFMLWLSPKIGRFPRDQRFTLGEKMERELYSILELLIRARYCAARKPLLEQANTELEVLRYQIRLAKDLRCLPLKSYGLAAEQLTDIGRQIGGWQKQSGS